MLLLCPWWWRLQVSVVRFFLSLLPASHLKSVQMVSEVSLLSLSKQSGGKEASSSRLSRFTAAWFKHQRSGLIFHPLSSGKWDIGDFLNEWPTLSYLFQTWVLITFRFHYLRCHDQGFSRGETMDAGILSSLFMLLSLCLIGETRQVWLDDARVGASSGFWSVSKTVCNWSTRPTPALKWPSAKCRSFLGCATYIRQIKYHPNNRGIYIICYRPIIQLYPLIKADNIIMNGSSLLQSGPK